MSDVIELGSGWKIDMIIRKDRPFSVAELERRVRSTAFGFPVWIATAEDVIVSKLECARRGGSERQVDDAKAIVRVRRDDLDIGYLRRWAEPLGVGDLLDGALA